MEKSQSLQQMMLEKLDSDMQKNETEPLSCTIHKNKLKINERPKCETGNHQNPTRKQAVTSLTSTTAISFFKCLFIYLLKI